MLLGSTEYNSSCDSDPDFVESNYSKENKRTALSKAEEIKQDCRLLNKIERQEERERVEKKRKRKSTNVARKQRKLNEMKNDTSNLTQTPTTSASSVSSQSNKHHVVAQKTLCGYLINPVEVASSPLSTHTSASSTCSTTAKKNYNVDPNHVCRGCKSVAIHCANKNYGKVCIHGVLDYYDKVGLCFTDEGIRKAYQEAYFVAARRDICIATG